jgi:transcriptional regulator with XRE-family HTH domain
MRRIDIFAERFKHARMESGYTQEQFAESINVTRSAITNWERGVTYPSSLYLIDICECLRVSSDYLLGIGE